MRRAAAPGRRGTHAADRTDGRRARKRRLAAHVRLGSLHWQVAVAVSNAGEGELPIDALELEDAAEGQEPQREEAELEEPQLDEAQLQEAQLEDALFAEDQFEENQFEEAQLEETPFEESPLEELQLEDTELDAFAAESEVTSELEVADGEDVPVTEPELAEAEQSFTDELDAMRPGNRAANKILGCDPPRLTPDVSDAALRAHLVDKYEKKRWAPAAQPPEPPDLMTFDDPPPPPKEDFFASFGV